MTIEMKILKHDNEHKNDEKKTHSNEMKIEVKIKLLDIGRFWVPSSSAIVRVCVQWKN